MISFCVVIGEQIKTLTEETASEACLVRLSAAEELLQFGSCLRRVLYHRLQ